jgi:hypothetical protein
MNIKLLKKVRKRFTITHYPKGVYIAGEFYEGPIVFLYDKDNPRYGYHIRRVSELYSIQEAISKLKDIILVKLKNEGYGKAKRNRINKKGIQVWP